MGNDRSLAAAKDVPLGRFDRLRPASDFLGHETCVPVFLDRLA